MGTIKARNIVPGWPRGRSTSNMGSGNSARDFMETGITWPRWAWEHIGDPRFTEDLEAERQEERRKTEMMEQWYRFQRPLVSARELALFGFTTQEQPTLTLTAGRDPEPVLCEEERRKEKD